MSDIGFFDPEALDIYIALLYEVKGFSSDGMVSIRKEEDSFKASTGSSGVTERISLPSNNYLLEFPLAQTSPTNSILTTILNLDKVTNRAVFPVYIKDRISGSLFFSDSCFITRPPDVEYTGNIETRKWSLYCTNVSFSLSGSETKDMSAGLSSLVSLASSFNSVIGG